MSDDRDEDRDPPPAPKPVPKGPLRGMGDAYAEAEQNRQANQQRQGPPPPESSPLEKLIQQQRERVDELQRNHREIVRRRQEAELNAATDQFNQESAGEMNRLRVERLLIEARHDGGTIRGWFNRLSGRVTEDRDRLRDLNAAEAQWQAKQEEQLAALRERHEEERKNLTKDFEHWNDELARTIAKARETGQFPEYARLTRDPPGFDPERER